MQVFFILFSVHFAVYQYINSKCLYRTHVKYRHERQLKVFRTKIDVKNRSMGHFAG